MTKPADQPADKSKPWYENGLRFTCTGCGDCCTGAPGYVWVKNDEIAAIAEYLDVPPEECEREYVHKVGVRKSLIELPNYDCVFLDSESRKCKIYPVRPRQCRTWPFWGSNVRTPETWAETCRVCPGSGTGRLYSIEEVESQVAVVKV